MIMMDNTAHEQTTNVFAPQNSSETSSYSANGVADEPGHNDNKKQSLKQDEILSTPLWQTPHFWRELMAETIGTWMIVFWGTGAVMSAVITEALVGLFQIASVWIIGVTMAIAATASISGAHLNPSITISFWLIRDFPMAKVVPYICAQICGAMFASWCNLLMYASVIRQYENENNILRNGEFPHAVATAKCFGEYYLEPVTTPQAFLVEALGTAVLAAVIFALTHPGNDTMIHHVYIPPLIGMTVGGLISILAPLTQAGFNPARDFGPRVVAYRAGWTEVAFEQAWLYIVAPIVGAPIGAGLMDFLLYNNPEEKSKKVGSPND